jgi:hypothetical protein
MKKIVLIIILACMPLIAQYQEETQETAFTFEGTIFEISDNKINFNETWMLLSRLQVKGFPVLVITNRWDEPVGISDLQAPCRVELTYIEHDKAFVPIKIKILEYYQYDENGFILSTHD